ncbi:hypothetical protein [Alkalihalobacillus sp. CinArs1]|uniref:hypothetical protein n=1 Tax=Alkalihalobacillus sp. CinArs1 TaxID=2995314 RepID=UPI0022DDEB99|nr:hypothetical protein [Alkalihalobacillus sp. CinArs1]
MKKIAFLIMMLGLLMNLVPENTAFACSCAKPSVEEVLEDPNTVIFSGVVKGIDENKGLFTASTADPVSVSFQVEKTYKNLDRSRVLVSTARSSASCGYEFEEGKGYLVYGYEREGSIETNFCTRTVALSEAGEDLLAIGGGVNSSVKVEEPLGEKDSDWIIWMISTLIVIILVLYILKRRINRK